MTDVILFHHIQGLTPGVEAFADRLRSAGHRVTVPDLFDGATFDSIEAGSAHAEQLGFDEIVAAGVSAAMDLPAKLVCAGFSMGVLPAQKVAQTRPGVLGALLYHSAVPPTYFGDWPASVAVQLHLSQNDPLDEGDLDAAETIAAQAADGELFVYPGSGHLIADESLPGYDAAAAALIVERSLRLLARWP